MEEEDIPTNLLFEIFNKNRTNMSKVFSNSATWVDSQFIDSMLDQGIIQRVMADNIEKYALTYKGIAETIQTKYGKNLRRPIFKLFRII